MRPLGWWLSGWSWISSSLRVHGSRRGCASHDSPQVVRGKELLNRHRAAQRAEEAICVGLIAVQRAKQLLLLRARWLKRCKLIVQLVQGHRRRVALCLVACERIIQYLSA